MRICELQLLVKRPTTAEKIRFARRVNSIFEYPYTVNRRWCGNATKTTLQSEPRYQRELVRNIQHHFLKVKPEPRHQFDRTAWFCLHFAPTKFYYFLLHARGLVVPKLVDNDESICECDKMSFVMDPVA